MSSIAKETHDILGRRSRLHPQSTGKRITLQERDWLWLQLLHEHGPLSSSFLLEAAKDHGSSEKRAKERLTDLFHEGNTAHGGQYLMRPPQQFCTIDTRYNQLVYDASPTGERALKEAGVWRARAKAATGPWLHSFMVSSITASIKLTVDAQSHLEFIPQADILDRAGAELSWPVSIVDPATTLRITKDLKPDALFGLKYKTDGGNRYRFFVVEADRATEPLTSKNFNRKSALWNLLQYRAYIAEGVYKKHLKLTAPLLALNVSSDPVRTERMLKLIDQNCSGGNPYILFQTWDDFAPPFRPPEHNTRLLFAPWQGSHLQKLIICDASQTIL